EAELPLPRPSRLPPPLAYVRLSPSDFRAVASAHERVASTCRDLRTLRTLLTQTLAEQAPELAESIRRLSDRQLAVLDKHLRPRAVAPACEAFSPEEWRAVALSSRSLPALHRLSHAVRRILVLHFRESVPELARKLGTLSVEQFRGLLDRARRLLPEGQ